MKEHYHSDIQGWFDADFAKVYREAVARVPDGGTIVELGCWKGKSFAYLLVEAANSGKKLRVVGVDHFRGSAGEPPMQHEADCIDLYTVCNDNAARSEYPFELYREESPEAAGRFQDASVDFVFIDAAHLYQCVVDDIKAWLPKVKPGGVIAGHDYDLASVKKAVTELLPEAVGTQKCFVFEVPTREPGVYPDGVQATWGGAPKPKKLKGRSHA